MKKYSLEEIMSAWSQYQKPLVFMNVKKIDNEKYKDFIWSKTITKSQTFIDYKTRQQVGIGFPEFLMELQESK